MLNELEQKIRKAIPELFDTLGRPKPIKMNDVLRYVIEKHTENYSEYFATILYFWNLKSNLLSEQSDELIKFINEL